MPDHVPHDALRGLRWSAATAAFQIEGARSEGGRGRSIWDDFVETAGAVRDGSHGRARPRQLPPLRRGRRAARAPRRRPLPLLDLVGARAADRHGPGERGGHRLLRPRSSMRCSTPGSRRSRRSTTGISRRRSRQRGRLAQPRDRATASPTTRLSSPTRSATASSTGTRSTSRSRRRCRATRSASSRRAGSCCSSRCRPSTTSCSRTASPTRVLRERGADDDRDRQQPHRRASRVRCRRPTRPRPTSTTSLHNRIFAEPVLLGRYPDLEAFGIAADARRAGRPRDHLHADRLSTASTSTTRRRSPRRRSGQPDPVRDRADPAPPTTGLRPGWPIVPEALTDVLVDFHERYGERLPPIVDRRERRIVPRARRRRRGRSTTPTASPTSPATSTRSGARASAACRSRSTPSGRCSTTSSGPRASRSGSGSCTSTIDDRGAHAQGVVRLVPHSHRGGTIVTTHPGRVGAKWFILFTLAWLALWTVQLTPLQLLIPLQLNTPDDADGWISGVVSSGLVLAVGGVAGVIAGPLAGGLSDRTRGAFGRRRPWALVGRRARHRLARGDRVRAGSVGRRPRVGRRVGRRRDRLRGVHRAHRRPAHDAARRGIRRRVVLAGARHRRRRRRHRAARARDRHRLPRARGIPRRGRASVRRCSCPTRPRRRSPRSPAKPRARSARLAALRDRDFAWMLGGPTDVNIGNALGTGPAAVLPAVRSAPRPRGRRGRPAPADRRLHACSSSRRRSCPARSPTAPAAASGSSSGRRSCRALAALFIAALPDATSRR